MTLIEDWKYQGIGIYFFLFKSNMRIKVIDILDKGNM
jgi:hypothetical protein